LGNVENCIENFILLNNSTDENSASQLPTTELPTSNSKHAHPMPKKHQDFENLPPVEGLYMQAIQNVGTTWCPPCRT